MTNAIDNLRHLIDCYAWRDNRDMQDFIDAADMIDMRYVALPLDADGVPIHVGDVMEAKGSGLLFGKASFEVRIMIMRCDECGWEVYDRFGDRYAPSLLRHHHAPTVEDVMVEFATDWECAEDGEDKAAVLKEYAIKLRLAGDGNANG